MPATPAPTLADSVLLPWNYWMRALLSGFSINAAPQTLNQPILPWTFTGLVVNENNSSDPAAERAIVNEESYGRQLGRISDALAYLIEHSGADKKNDAVQAFTEMNGKIKEIKRKAEDARFKKVLADLDRLRKEDEKAFVARLALVAALAKK